MGKNRKQHEKQKVEQRKRLMVISPSGRKTMWDYEEYMERYDEEGN